MIEDLLKALKELKIESQKGIYEGNEDQYIIYSIFNEIENDFLEDQNEQKKYSVTFNYYYKDPDLENYYLEIIKTLKKFNFELISAADVVLNSKMFCKNIDMEYIEDIDGGY